VRDANPRIEDGLRRASEACRQAARQAQLEQQALAALNRLLGELAEENLRIHRRNAAILDGMREDLERIKRQLKRLSTARA
jgi:replicative DNA helicase